MNGSVQSLAMYTHPSDTHLLLGQHVPELLHADLQGNHRPLSGCLHLRLNGRLLTYVNGPRSSFSLVLGVLWLNPTNTLKINPSNILLH